MNNRDLIKKAIKKLVLQEIANNQFGVQVHVDNADKKGSDALGKAMGKNNAGSIIGTGKTAGSDDNQKVELSKNAEDNYDVVHSTFLEIELSRTFYNATLLHLEDSRII